MPLKETQACVLRIAPECPRGPLMFINFPDPDSATVVYACGRCVGTLARAKLVELGRTPVPVARG